MQQEAFVQPPLQAQAPPLTRNTHPGPAPTLTLQAVELPSAVLPGDVLPVGAAGQGRHGAQ